MALLSGPVSAMSRRCPLKGSQIVAVFGSGALSANDRVTRYGAGGRKRDGEAGQSMEASLGSWMSSSIVAHIAEHRRRMRPRMRVIVLE